jgi:hypothetical protein
VFSATQKIHFFFLLFTSTLKFKRFKEDPFAQKPKKYCFKKEDDFPDQQWVAEIEENDVFFTANRRNSSTTPPSCQNRLHQFRALHKQSILLPGYIDEIVYSIKNKNCTTLINLNQKM